MTVFEKIYEVVKTIPKGRVATYGQVAFLAGNPRWARVVGYALHNNPSPETIPCHRVVNREGKVAEAFVFGGGAAQTEGAYPAGSSSDATRYPPPPAHRPHIWAGDKKRYFQA